MTAITKPCRYRWPQTVGDGWWHGDDHDCAEPTDHPAPCRCRCGATTTKEQR